MKYYVTESIDMFKNFGEIITNCANTTTKEDIFNKDEDKYTKLLKADKAGSFNHVVSKLLYVSKLARVDIELGISYIYTRV